MNRQIGLVMDPDPLIVNDSMPIAEVSILAMQRKQDNLYDSLIVVRNGALHGIVSIKTLLNKLTEVQVMAAKYSNPLTGLPGNYVIEEKIQETLSLPDYTVLYLDLDSFKIFNDTYGFKKGDELIRGTSIIVNEAAMELEIESFVGHIGGDDFIVVIPHMKFEPLCELIIKKFDELVKEFYSSEDLERGYIRAINRSGNSEIFPLVCISIAVLTNKNAVYETVQQLSQKAAIVKKYCKAIKKSVYLTLEECTWIH